MVKTPYIPIQETDVIHFVFSNGLYMERDWEVRGGPKSLENTLKTIDWIIQVTGRGPAYGNMDGNK